MLRKKIIGLIFIFCIGLLINSCTEKKFNPTTDLYKDCFDIELFFKYLEKNDVGIDFDSLPNNWLCEKDILFINEIAINSNTKCFKIDSPLFYYIQTEPTSTYKKEAERLLDWYEFTH